MSTLAQFRASTVAAPRAPHDPRTEMRIGGAIVGVFLFGFVGWSAIAHLDAAVHAPGSVRVSGNRQAVQSLAGGIVSRLDVREGDRVKAGQILVEFATTEALAQERSLARRAIGLQAEIARIRAEQTGAARIAPPAEWASLDGDERAEATRALAAEETNLAAARALRASERAVLRQRIAQTADQIGGYGERQRSNHRQGELNTQELDSVQQLYRQGYATRTRVLGLQRSAATIDGDIGATQAEIARLRTAAGETRFQMMQLDDQRAHDDSDRLRAAETELGQVLPQWKAAREQVERSLARAPVAGTVLGLVANTVGGVAQPGQKLMEIVPSSGALEVEAQVTLGDANELSAGQKADVRIMGLHGRNLPPLHGTVSRVSADSLTDEKTGRAYFTATVRVPRAELDRIGQEAGIAAVKPGTPVDVAIPLGSRTALQYWIGPLAQRLRPALSER
jgi:HlyD family secretion protein